jgi:4-amino-4-deoxy-L-arabinose transferase-like glycosyltransferase
MIRRGLAFAALCIVFCGITVLWLWLDQSPPWWDDASYLTKSLRIYDTLTQDGIFGYIRHFLTAPDVWANLLTVLPTPIFLTVGRRTEAAFGVNIASMVILFAALYFIGSRLGNFRVGFLSIAFAGTMPLLYTLSRWFMVEYPLAAVVAVAYLLLISVHSHQGGKWRPILFGVLSGIGLLLKVTYPLYVLPFFLYVLLRSKRPAQFAILAAVPCVALAFPWYLLHYREVLQFAINPGYGSSATVYGTGSVFSLSAIMTYLGNVIFSGVSLYYAVLAGMVVIVGVVKRPAEEPVPGKGALPLIVLWLLPFLVFLFGVNKDVRYIAPILPAFCLALAIGLDRTIPRNTWGNKVMGLAVLYPVVALLSVSFDVPLLASGGGYSLPYAGSKWPQPLILKNVSESHAGNRVLITSNLHLFNVENFKLAAEDARLPLNFETTTYEDAEGVLRAADRADFIVLREGGAPESQFLNVHVDEVRNYVQSKDAFVLLGSYPLPDGGTARLYRNVKHRLPHTVSFLRKTQTGHDEFAAVFGEMLELTALSTEESDGVLRVRLRWHCLKPADRDYWSFVHIVNESDAIIGYLDHALLGGLPPTPEWQPGDVGIEDLEFQLPAGESHPRLRLGVFHLESGERLPVKIINAAASSRFTEAEAGTALLTR